jgi:hypothetical protein
LYFLQAAQTCAQRPHWNNANLKKHAEHFGGADGIRTHDLLDAIEARSQLRHGPTGELLKQC